jgi:hypothetical protein
VAVPVAIELNEEERMVEAGPASRSWLDSMIRRFQWLLIAEIIVWIVCELLAHAGISDSPIAQALSGRAIFLAPGMISFVFLFLALKPSSREFVYLLVHTVVFFLGLSLILSALDKNQTFGFPSLFSIALGVASIAGLLRGVVWGLPSERRLAIALLLVASLGLVQTMVGQFFLILSIYVRPETYDLLAFAADEHLGVQISFMMGRLFEAFPVLAGVSSIIYFTLAAPILLILGMQMHSKDPPLIDIYIQSLIIGLLGLVFYLIFPVVGPAAAFGPAFPQATPALAEVLANGLDIPAVSRNCMPSCHTAWALMVHWHARPLAAWVRVMASVYLLFTLLATLGFGFHYVFDLVVAVPFAVAIQSALTPASRSPVRLRRWAIGSGIVLMASWLLVLRFGTQLLAFSNLATIVMVALTVLFPLVLENRLYRRVAGNGRGATVARLQAQFEY